MATALLQMMQAKYDIAIKNLKLGYPLNMYPHSVTKNIGANFYWMVQERINIANRLEYILWFAPLSCSVSRNR